MVESACWSTLLVGNYIIIQFSNDLEGHGCVEHFWLGNAEAVSIILNPEQVMNGKNVLQGLQSLKTLQINNSAETQ